ncbi:hypothetical protein L53_06050 [Hyphomonas sp. L-53-1-40]|nr:hypothetical protein L53_06050 [Hyphomonas sp. L-53-1-40]
MSPQSDIGKTPVTSLDLLRELQGEQKAFRFLIRALAVLLVTAAVIAVGSVIYFYVALQGLKSEYAYQARLNEGKPAASGNRRRRSWWLSAKRMSLPVVRASFPANSNRPDLPARLRLTRTAPSLSRAAMCLGRR